MHTNKLTANDETIVSNLAFFFDYWWNILSFKSINSITRVYFYSMLNVVQFLRMILMIFESQMQCIYLYYYLYIFK